jgi:hypothetical protein
MSLPSRTSLFRLEPVEGKPDRVRVLDMSRRVFVVDPISGVDWAQLQVFMSGARAVLERLPATVRDRLPEIVIDVDDYEAFDTRRPAMQARGER